MQLDFGLTALGEKFHMEWRYDGPNPRDVVRHWGEFVGHDEAGREDLRRLDEDVRLLLASPLSDDEIHALWRVAAMFYPAYPVNGQEPPRGRVWLAEIAAELRPFVEESADGAPVAGVIPDAERSAVIALAGRLTPRAELPLEPLPASTVIAAVERCATLVSAALAFRFLLRAYSAYNSPVPATSWAAFEELNSSFGYGEFMLATIEYLRAE
ncbi:hypothetical protein [Streptomyces melanogenes]|uniref:CdiI immunity protein domain-containing protein n=1 Tax=Streptomyces melanogenes TaxID=67326 RepID=A0ABZ1XDZ2_9ACTN|nr:hypothetical protein [Streptomyces melanogenes]